MGVLASLLYSCNVSSSSRSRRGEQLERLTGVLKKHGLDCGALRGNKVKMWGTNEMLR